MTTLIINETIEQLTARLPELAWKLSSRYSIIPIKLLPPGLFRYQFEMTPQTCIDDIRKDLHQLNYQKKGQSLDYLALQISKKVNVLIRLCATPQKEKKDKPRPPLNIKTISTRQQWLKNLEEEIKQLSLQQISLQNTLNKLKHDDKLEAILRLQAELGEIERYLTLAQETLKRATS